MENSAESMYTIILGDDHLSSYKLIYRKKVMNLSPKTVLIPSIVLLIGTVLGTSATNAFAHDPFKKKVNIDTQQDNTNSCDDSQRGETTSD